MRTATRLFETRVGINHVNPMFNPPQLTNRFNSGKIPHLRIASREPLCMEGSIVLHVYLADFEYGSLFSINLTVDMQPETIFIDRLIREIFSAEQVVFPSHHCQGAILSVSKRTQYVRTSTSIVPGLLVEPSGDVGTPTYTQFVSHEKR